MRRMAISPFVPSERAREHAAWMLRNGWATDTLAAERELARVHAGACDASKSSAMAAAALRDAGNDVAQAIALLESTAPLSY